MQTEIATDSVSFASLALCEPLKRALADKGYTEPSPIQAQAIPLLLEGRDLVGLAQTGTGKTAAFALPILHRLAAAKTTRTPRRPRALILTPTRELAVQIAENIALYGKHMPLRSCVIFGGVGEQPQIRALAQGVDIVVATPGRLLDLMGQGHAFLDRVEIFVLDEADRMLDMGFAPDVKRIVANLPAQRQSLLFSATMPESIRELAGRLLRNPERIEVTPGGSTVDRVEQRVCNVARADKQRLLEHFVSKHPGELVLVFTRTKHGANNVAKRLVKAGFPADAIHGNKSQGARQRALENFRKGEVPVLIATDIAARGIDVKEVALVINFDLPEEPEAYVHRIGRTARAGASGLAIAFCDHEERGLLRDIQRLIRKTIRVDDSHPYLAGSDAARPAPENNRGQQSRGPREGHRNAPTGHHHQKTSGPAQGNRHGQQQHPRPHGSTEAREPSRQQGGGIRANSPLTRGKPAASGFRWDFWRK